jgi:cell wall-associated NlpC family hydrolase
VKFLTSGAVVTFALLLTAAPAAMAQEPAPTGGTAAAPTTTTTTTPAPAAAPGPTADATAANASVSPTATVKLTRSQTKRVQKRVHVPADGALGSRTRSALKRYQGTKRLTRTGRPNLETIRAMKMPFVATVEKALAQKSTARTADTTAPATGDVAPVIAAARSAIGTPYVSGGNDTSGFDCSGLTVWAFAQAGIELPRTSFDQYGEGTAVDKAAIQPGDLVFFSTAGDGASHVGIATSATTVISATTKGVMEHQLDDDYWGAAYVGARRVVATP